MSNGEERRINLGTSQAFAYVMMLNCGRCPSLVFLDEVTGGSIDKAGVIGIYNMIFELAKDRQVFVTTHNENLLQMLQGCEAITLKKENDITVLVS
jgi:ABC-type multidrug transport system ATPase subunit